MKKSPLEELRDERKLTGLQMAMILDFNPFFYYELEKGYHKLSKKVLMKLKERFNIEPDEFKKRFDEWRENKVNELLEAKK